MAQAYCLTHVEFEGPGVFEYALRDKGYEITTYNVPERGLPSSGGDLLLIMGGPMSANDNDPWIREEIEFIQRSVKEGHPVIGICLGAQLLAKALGGSVYKSESAEIGMTTITLTPEGKADPAFQDIDEKIQVFEWHGEGIENPPGASVLAASEAFPVQAFRQGNALGLLFHIEIERMGIEALLAHCKEDVKAAGLNNTLILQKAKLILPLLQQWARKLIEQTA